MTVRPRRSMLYMPGSNARAMEKARELPADAVIFDLEDAVAPDAKAAARELVVEALKKGGFGRSRSAGADQRPRYRLVARRFGRRRRRSRRGAGAEDFHARAAARSGQASRRRPRRCPHLRLWAMMETPLAMLNAREIAAAALDQDTRLAGFVMGTNDLAKETRARILPGRAPMLPWLMNCVAAARAYGIDILDGVYNELGDAEGFAAECAQARDLGFDGKTLIHPQQIAPCNAAFSPTPGRGGMGAENHRRVRSAGKRRQGRAPDRRPHGRAAACRHGAAVGGDRRGDRAGLRPAQAHFKSSAGSRS